MLSLLYTCHPDSPSLRLSLYCLYITFKLTCRQATLTLTLTTHEVPPMYPLLENYCLISSVCKHAARPNTAIHYPLLVPHQLYLPRSQLSIKEWERATLDSPDRAVITTILGICRYGARIGYEGHRETPTIYPNLPIAQTDEHLLSSDNAVELGKNPLAIYPEPSQLPNHYTASPLGLIDKSDGSKRRIHHLSYHPLSVGSINSRIPEHYGTIS